MMANTSEKIDSTIEKTLFIKMIVDAWHTQNARVTKLIENLTDEQLLADTAPGRNSGFYLLGHLTAVSDALLPLLGWGERVYPELDVPFVKNPDKSGLPTPSLAEIKKYWYAVHAKIAEHINQMTANDWFTKHTSVSLEDFAKEPHRNKLNILINRTNHTSNHLGQLNYLVKK
jgi:hypothetical protein